MKKERHGRDPFDIFSQFDELFNQMVRDMNMDMFGDRESRPFVYGFSLSQRPGEEPEIREFGNIYPQKDQIEIGERRPLIDVFEVDDNVQVVAEMPGIEKEDVDLDVEPKKLHIRAAHGARKYNEVVDLPVSVEIDSAKATLRNGVLEVTLKKTKNPRSKKKVKVE